MNTIYYDFYLTHIFHYYLTNLKIKILRFYFNIFLCTLLFFTITLMIKLSKFLLNKKIENKTLSST